MTGDENPLIAAHAERMRWFLQDRFGLFIHWGLYALPARGEWVRSVERISNEAYQAYFDKFHPDHYDPAAWARLAIASTSPFSQPRTLQINIPFPLMLMYFRSWSCI